MSKKLVIVTLCIFLLIVACLIYVVWFYFLAPRPRVIKHFPLVATYQFEVKGHAPHEDYDQFLRDLDLIVELGFRGVKLWNIEGYYDTLILDKVARDLKERGLVFVVPFQFWERNQFPYNTTKVDEFADYVEDVAKKLRDKENLLWYALHYPFNWTIKEDFLARLKTDEYKQQLQRIIDAINSADGIHPVYMVLEFPPDFYPPYDLTGVEGFGVQPYSLVKDDIDKSRINEHLNFYKKRGNKVYY